MQSVKLRLLFFRHFLRHKDTQIGQRFRQNAAHQSRRKFRIVLVRHIGPVHHNVNCDLRIIRRRIAHKGNHIVYLVTGNHLRCTRLAADGIAGRSCRHTGPFDHNAITVIDYRVADAGRDRLFQHSRLDRPHRGTVLADDPAHHMRFIIIAAVDQGTESCDHLDHRHIEPLSEGTGSQFRGPHILLLIDQSHRSRLACQIDIGFQPEVKIMLVVAKIAFPFGFRDIHKCHVAGFFHSLFYSQFPIPVGTVALDGPASYLPLSGAQIGLISLDRAAVQSRRHRKRLDRGTRFVGIRNTVISPQLIIGIIDRAVLLHGRDLLRRI